MKLQSVDEVLDVLVLLALAGSCLACAVLFTVGFIVGPDPGYVDVPEVRLTVGIAP